MFGTASKTFITGGTFLQQLNISSKGGFERLIEAASPAAFHNSNDRRDPPKCHPNTRVAVLKRIMDWIHGLDAETQGALMMWLYGPAGSGKSAIAQSIAELCYEQGILVASYFFSRFDSTRNHPRSIVATIAYQASQSFPGIRQHITASIDHDPLIFSRSVDAQILNLVIQPLQDYINSGYFDTPAPTRVVIIDGLDECADRSGQLEILAAISKALQQHRLPFTFLIACRPEHDIRTAFSFGYLKDITTRVQLDDEYLPSDDIRVFFQDNFTEIKEIHPFRANIPPNWPDGDILETLVRKSSGQFIYASTVVKFVQSSRHRPPHRLDIALGIRPAQRDMPFAELDALYMHIFSCVEDPESVLRILAYKLLVSDHVYHLLGDMEMLLSLHEEDISVSFCDLTSLVSVEVTGRGAKLRILHASLEDFLLDQSRSQQFWINAKIRHAEFAHLYLKDPQKFDGPSGPYHFLHSFREAAAAPDLLEDLRKLPIGSILVSQARPQIIPEFLACIENLGFDNWTELYSHQLQLFDQFAQGIMEKMYSHPGLNALVAIFLMNTLGPQGYTRDLLSLDRSRGGRVLWDDLRFASEVDFRVNHSNIPEYAQFIAEFLGDPARCGPYGFTGERCAIAAQYFLEYICDHPKQIIQSRYAHHWKYQRRRSTPWLWRKCVLLTAPSEAAKKIQRRAIERWARYHRDQPRTYPYDFQLALRCLSFVLPQSDRSEELIVFASRRTFGPLSRLFPRQTRIAKQELARYLARVDPGKPSDV